MRYEILLCLEVEWLFIRVVIFVNGILVEIFFFGRYILLVIKLYLEMINCMNIKCVGKVFVINYSLLYMGKFIVKRKKV